MVLSVYGGGGSFKYRPGSIKEATQALALGTLLAVAGVGSATYGFCRLFGISSFLDFRMKMESLFGKTN